MKWLALGLTVLTVGAIVGWWLARPAEPSDGPRTATLTIGNARLTAEVVRTPSALARGLSDRTNMAADHGMLFVFTDVARHPFWMKDMRFPLDFIWISGDGDADGDLKVAGVTPNITPASYPHSYQPPMPVRYVLEVNSGWAAPHGVTAGQVVTITPKQAD